MFRSFVLEGVVFVALVAAIAFGIGMVVRAALPSVVHAADLPALEEGQQLPRIVAVKPAASGWDIELDSQVSLHIEPRVADTGGVAPMVGQVQSFHEQTCMLGACAGYAVITDQRGVVYHGYRP